MATLQLKRLGPEPWGDRMTRARVSAGFNVRQVADAGLKSHRFDGVSAHALRHTCASDVLERSGDLRAVQDMLGHQSLATTSVYLRSTSSRALREAMEGRLYDAA